MKVLLILSSAVLTALILSSCHEPKEIKNVTLPAASMHTIAKPHHDWEDWVCATPCPSHSKNCGWAQTNNVLTGYEYEYDPGTKPCDCWWYLDCAWRGVVSFDLSAYQGKSIVSAELSYSISNDVSGPTNETNCLSKIFAADAPANSFKVSGDELGSYSGVSAPGPINISSTVRRWVDGSLANNGLIFIGFDESLPTDKNRKCSSLLSNMQLKILYTD